MPASSRTADRTRARRLDCDPEGRDLDVRKRAGHSLGKPGQPREKAILVERTDEKLGVAARSMLDVDGIARSTYHYQINAMERPDKDAPLLELVCEAFENGRCRYGRKRIRLELKGMGITVSGETVHEADGQTRTGASI